MRSTSSDPRSAAGGFTLLELIVVVAILVGLAAVMIPMTRGIDDAQRTRALADCTTLGKALLAYYKDTRFPPTGQQGQATFDYLLGDLGTTPALGMAGTWSAGDLSLVSRQNTWNSRRWRGPYVEVFPPDPWGNRYVAWVRGFKQNEPVWIVSAGPDGVVQTGPGSTSVQGDDVGMSVE